MNKSSIIIALVLLVGVAALWYTPRTTRSRACEDVLIVGTNAEYPPFAFMRDGTIVGFDIDIAREVATRLAKRMVLKDMPFDALLPKLQLGDVHMLAAGMTMTPERALRVNFTKPYLANDPLLIITLASHPMLDTVDALQGKKVVVNEGYTADLFLSGCMQCSKITLYRLASPSEAFLALTTGRADAFVTAQSSVQSFFDKHKRDNFHITIIPGVSDNYALALSKQYPALLNQVQQALDAMEQDGTLQRLKEQWGIA